MSQPEVQAGSDAEPRVAAREDVRRASERILWLESSERAALRARRFWALLAWTIAGVIILTVALLTGVFTRSINDADSQGVVMSSAVWVGAGYFGYLYFGLMQTRARRLVRDREIVGVATSELQAEERSASEAGSLQLGVLWALTQQRIDLYHTIATGQAQDSFRNGTIASAAGLTVLIAAAVAAALAPNPIASISAGAIGVAGAALSGFIASTFLKLQREATSQLREFFLQPVEFARFLGAERLIESLPSDQRLQAVQSVITSMMAGGSRAAGVARRESPGTE